jgi:hypothetical protein
MLAVGPSPEGPTVRQRVVRALGDEAGDFADAPLHSMSSLLDDSCPGVA